MNIIYLSNHDDIFKRSLCTSIIKFWDFPAEVILAPFALPLHRKLPDRNQIAIIIIAMLLIGHTLSHFCGLLSKLLILTGYLTIMTGQR